jgi:hypothetical protein
MVTGPPIDYEVNYMAIACNSACNDHYRGVFRKIRKKKVHLAGGEELLVVFLVVLGSPACGWWWQ